MAYHNSLGKLVVFANEPLAKAKALKIAINDGFSLQYINRELGYNISWMTDLLALPKQKIFS